MPTSPVPPVPVTATLDRALLPDESTGSGADRVAEAIGREISSMLEILGLPGRVEAAIEIVEDAKPGERLALAVHARPCHYRPELLARVWSTLTGRVLDRPDPGLLFGAERPTDALLEEMVATACRQIVADRPSVLLSVSQASALVRDSVAKDIDPAWLYAALAPVLDVRISLGEADAVAELLVDFEGSISQDAAEAIIAARRPPELSIAIRASYLRELTLHPRDSQSAPLAKVRNRIADQLGIALPPFTFIDDPLLPERGFSIRVNHLETLPWIGLPVDVCLVDDDPSTLELLDIPATPAVNPVTELPNSLVPAARVDDARSYYLGTWDAVEYLALCLESSVRRHAGCLVDEMSVRRRLEMLQAPDTPAGFVRTRQSPRRVARILRALLDERVSVSDFPAILEVMAEQEDVGRKGADLLWSAAAGSRVAERDRSVVAAARRSLARQVAATVVTDKITNRIAVMVLDDGLHAAVASCSNTEIDIADEDLDALRRGVQSALERTTGPRWPALLTTSELRPNLRALLAPKFPELAVVAYEELPGDVSFDIVSMVSASGETSAAPAPAA
jgi:type III secretory pathway component EscV